SAILSINKNKAYRQELKDRKESRAAMVSMSGAAGTAASAPGAAITAGPASGAGAASMSGPTSGAGVASMSGSAYGSGAASMSGSNAGASPSLGQGGVDSGNGNSVEKPVKKKRRRIMTPRASEAPAANDYNSGAGSGNEGLNYSNSGNPGAGETSQVNAGGSLTGGSTGANAGRVGAAPAGTGLSRGTGTNGGSVSAGAEAIGTTARTGGGRRIGRPSGPIQGGTESRQVPESGQNNSRNDTRSVSQNNAGPVPRNGAGSVSQSDAGSVPRNNAGSVPWNNAGSVSRNDAGSVPRSDAGSPAASMQNGASVNRAPENQTFSYARVPVDLTDPSWDLVYHQPKITPVEFLDDAKKMMGDKSCKSAVVFTFFQDFFTDRSAPLQPYLELVSHLWDEYSSSMNENICIFLAPRMSGSDLSRMFDGMENGYILKNRFFNENGSVNRRAAIEVGLPNVDEIGYLMEYLRLLGVNGKRISFQEKEKKRICSTLLFLSREADKEENRSGYLYSIFNLFQEYMNSYEGQIVPINEEVVKGFYPNIHKEDNVDPLEKLKNTRGWESVAGRIEDIIKDYRRKRRQAELRRENNAVRKAQTEIRVEAAARTGKTESSLTGSERNEKTESSLEGSTRNGKTESSLAGSTRSEKTESSLASSVRSEKTGSSPAGSERNEKTESSLAGSVGNEKTESSPAGSERNEKTESSLASTTRSEKTESSLASSVRSEKTESSPAGSERNEKTESSLAGSVGNEKTESRDLPARKDGLGKSFPTAPPGGFYNERIDREKDNGAYRYTIPHFILRGNPGVGKTTVARLIGEIFYNEGILKKGTTIEAKRDDLVDTYVGGTAIKTTECVERADEGVLFIDDAYSLLDKGDEHNYPKEAIDTLVPIMTNTREYRFCLIMAGYPEPMDELLEMNAGLKSRFSDRNILTIEDYTPDILKNIFISNCKKDGYHFFGEEEGDMLELPSSDLAIGRKGGTDGRKSEQDASQAMEEESLDLDLFFTNLYQQRNRADFGNARDVVAIANDVKMQCSLRDDYTRCIMKEDFGEAAKYFVKRGVNSIDEIFEQIDRYVGMGFVKDLFRNVRYEILDTIDSKKRGITPETYPDHYIFAGNPGTGKTTVGKMMGEFYHVMNVMGGSETLFVDASDLIGSHVGESAKKTSEILQKAIDHNQLLYVDEAYQISDSHYGNEIVGAMMTKMTENADDFKIIFGMYSNKVEEFLKMNAGLSRRLRVVNFPDYKPDELLEIFDRTIAAQGCSITDEARRRVNLILTHKYNVRDENFGNAGEVKKLVQDMKRLRLERTYGSLGIPGAFHISSTAGKSTGQPGKDSNSEGGSGQGTDRYQYILQDIPEKYLKMVEDQVNPKSLDEIMEELNQQIGMSDLKRVIIQKQEERIYYQKIGESPDNICPGYYFFVGSPGTGKSTSARLFAECLHELGIVKTNRFYSCTAKDLIGQYVGETDKKTYALLQKAINGVLFIDEAYSLSYAGSHSDNNYKKEAVEQIIAFMDQPDHRRNSCIILAGYEKDMQGLYESNSGMRSRIEEVHFRDYSAKETYDIFALFCKKNGFTAGAEVEKAYVPMFEQLKKLKYFSNGRTARTIFEKTTQKVKSRVARADSISLEEAKRILPSDLMTLEEAVNAIGSDG
ncbi:MAG: AAA family ATPase, partial [Lachnospiraceae bacterium]|nr:AAA family ATPase [Lachnospiraceae bacterium]